MVFRASTCSRIGGASLSLILLLLFVSFSVATADSDEIGEEDEYDSSAASVPTPPPTTGRRNAQFSAQCKKQVSWSSDLVLMISIRTI